jgi:Amidohydrolase family
VDSGRRRIIAITGATLLDTSRRRVVPDTTVIVEGARVTFVGNRAIALLPPGTETIDATGKTLVPGLIDLHQHWPHEWDKSLCPERGITSVRFAGNDEQQIRRLRGRVERGEISGPRMFSVGPLLDQPPTARPDITVIVNNPEEARRAAKRLIVEEHVDALFVARRVDAACLRAIIETAHEHGRPVTGQVYRVSGRQAAEAGIDGLENTSRIPESPALDEEVLHGYRSVSHRLAMLARLWSTAPASLMAEILGTMASRHVEWAPAIVSFEQWTGALDDDVLQDDVYQGAPMDLKQAYRAHQQSITSDWSIDDRATWERAIEQIIAWVGYYHRIGGPVVVGTDTPFGAIAYHRELKHLRSAGLSSWDVIAAATVASARALRCADIGEIMPGKVADILVVDGDPLEDLGVLRRPTHVWVNGEHVVRNGRPTRAHDGDQLIERGGAMGSGNNGREGH